MVTSQPFGYSFLDEEFNKQYSTDERTGKIFLVFSILAILIACLGLFGLVTFAAEQRVKEIGIRKVLGATVTNIVTLLSKDFIFLVILSLVIASPVAGYFMGRWLEDFAYRIHITGWVYILAGVMAILIALCTVSFQAIRAAIANPVNSLRSE